MEIHSKTINGIKFFIKADNFLISQAQVLFRAIQSIPPDKIRDGYKIEIGFSVFICESINGGYKIVVPDYTNSPLLNTTDDLTIALWVLFEQTELLNYLRIDGVTTRFDDEIVIAKNVLEYPTISLQRYSDLGKEVSGWCIEAIEEKSDGIFQTIEAKDYQTIYAYQLLQKRLSLIKVLVLPYEYIVIFNGDEINEILNEKDESIFTVSCTRKV